ncbi:MAG: metallophosphoesterase family protein [Polyangiaceae bacterium]
MVGPSFERLAVMGGAYGNLQALAACVADARANQAEQLAFLGDAIGCCGHSEEVVRDIERDFSLLVAGNHEQQAVARSESCGCGYASAEDEAISCEAFQLATASLSERSLEFLGTWPERRIVEFGGGRVLLCHGSPGFTSEFLYEVELDDLRLEAWLDEFDVRGFVCTHSGLPFVRHLRGGRFAVNCGVVGKADHDGDPAVHYALIDMPSPNQPASIEIRRVEYDHEAWARRMEAAQIAPIFVEPVRTGVWTSGVSSLPLAERHRFARATQSSSERVRPELLERTVHERVLLTLRELRLLSSSEVEETLALFSANFPFFAPFHLASSVHVHVRVDDVTALPERALLEHGARLDHGRDGYVKYTFDGGLNLISLFDRRR